MTHVEEFVAKTRTLIAKERDAEIEETKVLQENVPLKELERCGVCLLRLVIASRHMGLYGRTVIQFEAANDMPSHSLTTGDIVGLSASAVAGMSDMIASGVVSRVTSSSISVAFDEQHDMLLELDDAAHYKLVKLANDVTYRRMQKALDALNSGQGNGQLINVLFGVSEFSPPFDIKDLIFYNDNLDQSQKEAVKFALCQREVSIIHGPPGTGKTTTVTEVIRQAVKSKLKVLACAPSNIAVDNLVEKLGSAGLKKIVRLGHPARLLPTIQSYSLDSIIACSDETKLVEDVRRDIDKALGQMKKLRNRGDRQRVRDDIKSLRRELRQRETSAISDILRGASVILGTLTTVSEDGPLSVLGQEPFDIVVIDECSQAIEAACWIALLRAKRCVLAGDHHQLPPTIVSEQAAKDGLAITLMERLLQRQTGSHEEIIRMLTVQYRMHDDIMRWSSEQMYEGRLVSHPSVAAHLLKDLSYVSETEETSVPMILIDTAGCNLPELDVVDGESKGNEGEADIAVMHVKKLIDSGLSPEDIAVIAPYNLQVELLRLRLSMTYPRLEVKSVDGFQGREKEAVIITLVRSNSRREVGFLTEDRRINVAVTRARRHLAVICDTETVTHHPFIKSLIDHMTTCGEVRSAEQYIQDGALQSSVGRPDTLDARLRPAQPSSGKKTSTGASGKRKLNAAEDKNGTAKQLSEHHQLSDDASKERQKRCEQFSAILSDFINDSSQTVHVFSSELTSHDRYLIHEIAEQLQLIHLSIGDGNDRHIEVQKVQPNSVKTNQSAPNKLLPVAPTIVNTGESSSSCELNQPRVTISSSSSLSQPDESDAESPTVAAEAESRPNSEAVMSHAQSTSNMVSCTICGNRMPPSNLELHTLRCSRMFASRSSKQAQTDVTKQSVSHRQRKKKSSSQQGPTNPNATAVCDSALDDFDAIVEAAIRDNKTCHMERCKNSTVTLGQQCAFCHKTFCLSHHIAEAHGCGEAARRHARATVAREGVLYAGSGVPSKKPDPVRRAHLESKLANRMSDLSEQRKKKQKDNKNK